MTLNLDVTMPVYYIRTERTKDNFLYSKCAMNNYYTISINCLTFCEFNFSSKINIILK